MKWADKDTLQGEDSPLFKDVGAANTLRDFGPVGVAGRRQRRLLQAADIQEPGQVRAVGGGDQGGYSIDLGCYTGHFSGGFLGHC